MTRLLSLNLAALLAAAAAASGTSTAKDGPENFQQATGLTPVQPMSFVASESKDQIHQAKDQSLPAKDQSQQAKGQSRLASADATAWKDRYSTDFNDYMHGQAKDYAAEYRQYMNEQAQKYESKFGDFKTYMHDKGQQWQQKYADYQKYVKEQAQRTKQWMDAYASAYEHFLDDQHQESMRMETSLVAGTSGQLQHASASPAQPTSFVASKSKDQSHQTKDQSSPAKDESQQAKGQSRLASADATTWKDRYSTDFSDYMHGQAKDYAAEYRQYMNEKAQKYESKFGDFKTYMHDKGQQWQQKYADYQKYVKEQAQRTKQSMDAYAAAYEHFLDDQHQESMPMETSLVAETSGQLQHQEHEKLQRAQERQRFQEEQQQRHSKLVEEQHVLDQELARAEARLRAELQKARQMEEAHSAKPQGRSVKKQQREPAPASLFVASLGERSPLTSTACLAFVAPLAIVASIVLHRLAGSARSRSELAAPLAADV